MRVGVGDVGSIITSQTRALIARTIANPSHITEAHSCDLVRFRGDPSSPLRKMLELALDFLPDLRPPRRGMYRI